MNLRTVALICHEGITSVECYFSDSEGGRKSGNYTYACPLTLANSLKPGDLIVAEHSTGGYKLARVDEVHIEPQFDPDESFNYSFLLAKIERDHIDALEQELEVAQERLQTHRTRSIRHQILGQFGISEPNALFRALPQAPSAPEEEGEIKAATKE